MRSLLRLAASALVAGAAVTALPATAQTKWDMPTGYPLANPHTVTINQFARDVEAATKGQLKITVHPNGSLFRASEIKRSVQAGQAQAGEVLMSLLQNENQLFGLDSLPFLATGFDDAGKLWRAQRPAVEKLLAGQGIRLLYAVPWPPQGIYAKKEIRSASDMKGLKWRAYNAATSKIAGSVGAQPITVQAAELSQALATGVVDSTMTSGATGVDSKIWESLTHYHTVNAWLPKNMIIVNEKAFSALDKATQDALLKAAREAEEKGWARMRAYDAESLDILRKNKLNVVAPTPQLMGDMKKIGEEMLGDWLKATGAEGKQIIDAYRK